MQSDAAVESTFLRVLDRIVQVSQWVAYLALWVMGGLLLYDVLMRNVLNMTSDWSLDVVQLVQVLLAFAAATPVLKSGGHISMEALTSISGKSLQRKMRMLSNALCIFGCFWMVALSWHTFKRSYQISEQAYGIALPLYPWKFLVPLCFLILALQFFRALAVDFHNKK